MSRHPSTVFLLDCNYHYDLPNHVFVMKKRVKLLMSTNPPVIYTKSTVSRLLHDMMLLYVLEIVCSKPYPTR